MEEKERYYWSQDVLVDDHYEHYDYIVDTKTDIVLDNDNFFKVVDWLNQQDKRIKELEETNRVCDKLQRDIECIEENYAQLESDYEKANELGLEPSYIKRVIKENEELKQQLADKDAEIQKWKSMAERSSSILDRFNYCGESIVYNTTRDQDKISFAVEKLVGVQKYISDNAVYLEEESFGREINDYIDNQIAELTHQHEGKGDEVV